METFQLELSLSLMHGDVLLSNSRISVHLSIGHANVDRTLALRFHGHEVLILGMLDEFTLFTVVVPDDAADWGLGAVSFTECHVWWSLSTSNNTSPGDCIALAHIDFQIMLLSHGSVRSCVSCALLEHSFV